MMRGPSADVIIEFAMINIQRSSFRHRKNGITNQRLGQPWVGLITLHLKMFNMMRRLWWNIDGGKKTVNQGTSLGLEIVKWTHTQLQTWLRHAVVHSWGEVRGRLTTDCISALDGEKRDVDGEGLPGDHSGVLPSPSPSPLQQVWSGTRSQWSRIEKQEATVGLQNKVKTKNCEVQGSTKCQTIQTIFKPNH